MKNFFGQTIIFICSFVLSLAAVELGLILLNSNGKNYNVEMWKYSKELKTKSANLDISHIHKKSSEAILQGVNIRTNSYGMRGDEPGLSFDRRILFIGSSITMGWGVDESDIFTTKIAQKFQSLGQKVDVLNSGVGNHNSTRYVENFFENHAQLDPTDIVVHYFLNDAEILANSEGNFITRNFQLGVLIWKFYHRYFSSSGVKNLETHYRNLYSKGSPAFDATKKALIKLSKYCADNNKKLYLAMVPDIHKLEDYPFLDIHLSMRKFANSNNFEFVDFLSNFQEYKSSELWNMPSDPHPNKLGHQIMADLMFATLLK